MFPELDHTENKYNNLEVKIMKKKIVKLVCASLAIMALSTNVVFAKEILAQEVNFLSDGGNVVEPRSRYLASGISEITNEGEGVLGIYADFTSYSEIPWAQITINLERRKGTSGSWSSVKTYVYEFTPDDDPNGTLHAGEVEFSVYGLATDYYYRLRCEHKVQTPSGSYETKNTQTNGVLLTSYPVYRSEQEIK